MKNGFITLDICWFHHNWICYSRFHEKNMESKLAIIKRNKEGSTKPIIWWIVGTVAWGVVSMNLIVWCFFV